MNRLISFALFFGISISIVGAFHYYIWSRLIRDPAWPQPWRGVATTSLITLAAAIPLSFVLFRALQMPIGRGAIWVIYTWMGMMFLLVVLLGAGDLVRTMGSLAQNFFGNAEGVSDPEKRLFLSRAFGGGLLGTAGFLGGYSVKSAVAPPDIKHVQVPLTRLPQSLDRFRMVQISDLHVGPTIGKDYVRTVVERSNALEPHAVVITGDLVDGSVELLGDAVDELKNLRARYGVYFVTGNHEYYSGVEEWMERLKSIGIRVLRNERVTIGDGNECFDLAGVDDWTASQFGGDHGHDLKKALRDRNEKRELVLLAHQPKAIYEAAAAGVGLQLSGHTHGGQIVPFNFLVRLAQPYIAGLDKHERTFIYVSRGTGYWGPPMRLGAPSELTHIELRSVAT